MSFHKNFEVRLEILQKLFSLTGYEQSFFSIPINRLSYSEWGMLIYNLYFPTECDLSIFKNTIINLF